MNTTYSVAKDIVLNSSQLKEAAETVSNLMRPTLKGLERSQWKRIHDYLFDILVNHNDVSYRIELYCEIGRIPASEIKPLSAKIEKNIDDISSIKNHLRPWVNSDNLYTCLDTLSNANAHLLTRIKELKLFRHVSV
jgi:hypothetical protein